MNVGKPVGNNEEVDAVFNRKPLELLEESRLRVYCRIEENR